MINSLSALNSFLFLSMMLVASCGGGSNGTGTDMGPSCATPSALANGLYQTTSVSDVSESCGLGLFPQDLMTARMVMRDAAAGTLNVTSQDGSLVLASGTVMCSSTTLVRGPSTEVNGDCQYTVTRTSQVEITGTNQLKVQYSEMRSEFKSAPSRVCTQTAPCAIVFTVELKM